MEQKYPQQMGMRKIVKKFTRCFEGEKMSKDVNKNIYIFHWKVDSILLHEGKNWPLTEKPRNGVSKVAVR